MLDLMIGYWKEEEAIGVIEMVLILIVLIGLVVLFKEQLTGLASSILQKVKNKANTL
ncbi:MAG: Flp1 family type IVb pilin [Lachnospiraceae bacterium]|nr:Flp1 family type IVb pilin [Lachnospiraceae bacterium]MDY5742807.1 Flp1 family type IVb pilin [Lachnospiraceae bacterium]